MTRYSPTTDRATSRATSRASRLSGVLSGAAVILPLGFALAAIAAPEPSESAPADEKTETVIEGQVFNHIGAGLEHATVTVARPAPDDGHPEKPLATATTNDTGDFKLVLSGSVSGKVVVTVHKDGYTRTQEEVELNPEDTYPQFVALEMPGAAVLFGLVQDARTKRPVAEAEVRVSSAFKDWSATAGADGTFKVTGLPPGAVSVTVDAGGYGREHFDVQDVAQLGHQIVLLKPERIVHLRVTDEQGAPVGDVGVECIDEQRHDFRSLVTDAEGKLSIRGLHFDTHLMAVRLTHERYVSGVEFDREIELPPDATESTHTLVLARAGSVTGTVTDLGTGQPLNGARVVVGDSSSNQTPRDWTGFDGTFRIVGVQPGRVPLTVHLRGRAPELFEIEVTAGQTKTQDVKLGPGNQVAGSVVDEDGAPLAGVHVMAVKWRDHDTLGLQALTDERGRFVIADAPDDEFLVTLLHQSRRHLGDQPVQAPKADYRFEMGPRAGSPGGVAGAKFKIGDSAPALEMSDLEGNKIRRADLKGKTVLLDFWATWCGPCVVEIPHLKDVYATFGERPDFALIGISLDDKADTVRRFIKKQKMPWPQVVGDKAGATKAADDYGVQAIPATFLITPDGKIQALDLPGPALKQQIEKLLTALEPA
ncbi:MAG: carboxypeptidase regulatory-like domain-containing protein [Planctomycetes bacterium]|nr:carboxypeptidase regulatory-like domain-containing protein [Planctomycetota bacterium]